jgi:glutaredoxin 3
MKKKALALNFLVLVATAATAIVIGGNLPYLVKQIRGPFKEADYRVHILQQPNNLTLYGTTTCSHCLAARAYLHKANIPFNDMMIDKSDVARKHFQQLKENAVPVLVSANRLVVGFDQKAYAELGRSVNRQ